MQEKTFLGFRHITMLEDTEGQGRQIFEKHGM